MDAVLTGFITLALAVLSGQWFYRTRDPLNPAGLQAGIWAFVCFAYQVLPHGLNVVSLQTFLVILGGAVAFSIGVALASKTPRSLGGQPTPLRAQAGRWFLRSLLIVLPIAVFPIVLMRAVELAESYWVTDSFYINLRIASVNEKNRYGILAYACTMSFASVFIEQSLTKKRIFEPVGWIVFAVSVGYAVVSTGRTFFFMLLIGCAGLLVQKRGANYRWGVIGLFSILSVFFLQGQALKKLELFDRSEGPIISALRTFGVYMLGGLAAFDHEVAHAEIFNLSIDNTFRSGFAVMKALGLDVEVVPLLKEWVYVPEPTNVYTVYLPYMEDFGMAGAVLCMGVLGVLHGKLRAAALQGDRRYMVIYALSLYPLLMQFFQDQYVSLLTTWLIMTAVTFGSIRDVFSDEDPAVARATELSPLPTRTALLLPGVRSPQDRSQVRPE